MKTISKIKSHWLYSVGVMLILSGVVANEPQAQTLGGNGGKGSEARFVAIREEIKIWAVTTQLKDLHCGEINSTQVLESFLKVVDSGKLRMTDERQWVGSQERTCKNIPQSQEIICNEVRFNQETVENLYLLVFHEYLGLAGIESNRGEESDYHISSQIRDYLDYRVQVKLGSIRKGAMGLEQVPNWKVRCSLTGDKDVLLDSDNFSIFDTDKTGRDLHRGGAGYFLGGMTLFYSKPNEPMASESMRFTIGFNPTERKVTLMVEGGIDSPMILNEFPFIPNYEYKLTTVGMLGGYKVHAIGETTGSPSSLLVFTCRIEHP